MMIWQAVHPEFDPDTLGFIPLIISDDDPRPAREQINDKYEHSGGWMPDPKFSMSSNGDINYPGDE